MGHSRVSARCMPSVVDIATIRAAIATTYCTWTRQATLQQDLKIIESGIASLGTMLTAYAPTSITTKIHVSPKRRIYFRHSTLLLTGLSTSVRRLFPLSWGFERNRDLDEAAGAADATACSGGGSLVG